MAAWRESFSETSSNVETEIGGCAGETRGVINCEFRREIGDKIGGKIGGEIGMKARGGL